MAPQQPLQLSPGAASGSSGGGGGTATAAQQQQQGGNGQQGSAGSAGAGFGANGMANVGIGAVSRQQSPKSNASCYQVGLLLKCQPSVFIRLAFHFALFFQVSSLTETSARKLCRKHPQKCISYTRNHIMSASLFFICFSSQSVFPAHFRRTYPGGMRIGSPQFATVICHPQLFFPTDSSNFSPHRLLEFWQCGLQAIPSLFPSLNICLNLCSIPDGRPELPNSRCCHGCQCSDV
jgi:hypothetical protein